MGAGLTSAQVLLPGVTWAEYIWYLVFFDQRACEDAHEFEKDPEGGRELMKNLKGRAVTKSDLHVRDPGCILEGGFKDGKSGGK